MTLLGQYWISRNRSETVYNINPIESSLQNVFKIKKMCDGGLLIVSSNDNEFSKILMR